MISYTFEFRGLFSSPAVVMCVDLRMYLGRNIQLVWEPGGEKQDVGSFPTHQMDSLHLSVEHKQNEQNFSHF